MKKLFILFIYFFCVYNSQAQITALKIEKPAEEPRVITPYDSLTNITRSNLPSLVGQQVQILPYIPFGESDLATGPTLYNSKPSNYGDNNKKVINPDTRFTIYDSRFGSFTNQVFDIVGVDSIFDNSYYKYRRVEFYLIVQNGQYISPHYLKIGSANDIYDANKNLEKRGGFSANASSEFIILGYFDKLRKNAIGKKYVLNNKRNLSLGGSPILYKVSDGSAYESLPEDLILTIKDVTLIDSNKYKGLAYIYSSYNLPDSFSNLYLSNFEDYNSYLASQKKQADWEKDMIRKYGRTNGQLIIEGRVKLGFTKQMCREAWGEPESINKSTGSWGTHEQWVYGLGSYLYFENGKLTAIDN